MNWRIIRAIARKDIVDAVRHRYAFFALVLPVAMSLLFRLVFPSGDGAMPAVAAYDPGRSRLVASLRETPGVTVRDAASLEAARQAAGDGTAGLVVPAGFDAAVARGARPSVTVYVNTRERASTLAGIRLLIERQVWTLSGRPAPARIAWTEVGPAPSRDPDYLPHFLLFLLAVMGLTMAGAFVVPLLIVEEKERHTLDALLASPARPAEIMAGKAITGLFYGVVIAAILMLLNRGFTGAWPVTMAAVVLGSLFAVAVGLVMGGAVRTMMEVNTWSTVVMLALFVPAWLTPERQDSALGIVSRAIPTAYLVDAMRKGVTGEATAASVGLDFVVLAGCVALAFAAAVWTLRREAR